MIGQGRGPRPPAVARCRHWGASRECGLSIDLRLPLRSLSGDDEPLSYRSHDRINLKWLQCGRLLSQLCTVGEPTITLPVPDEESITESGLLKTPVRVTFTVAFVPLAIVRLSSTEIAVRPMTALLLLPAI